MGHYYLKAARLPLALPVCAHFPSQGEALVLLNGAWAQQCQHRGARQLKARYRTWVFIEYKRSTSPIVSVFNWLLTSLAPHSFFTQYVTCTTTWPGLGLELWTDKLGFDNRWLDPQRWKNTIRPRHTILKEITLLRPAYDGSSSSSSSEIDPRHTNNVVFFFCSYQGRKCYTVTTGKGNHMCESLQPFLKLCGIHKLRQCHLA